MRYSIQVNIARKDAEPVWRDLVDEYDKVCWWDNITEARNALVEEGRGENARLMRYDASGIGRAALR